MRTIINSIGKNYAKNIKDPFYVNTSKFATKMKTILMLLSVLEKSTELKQEELLKSMMLII